MPIDVGHDANCHIVVLTVKPKRIDPVRDGNANDCGNQEILHINLPYLGGSRCRNSFAELEGANNEGQYITASRLNARLNASGVELQNGLLLNSKVQ